jgi:hypothetical protein
MDFDRDAFAHGPVESKIWLCHTFRNLNSPYFENVFVLGSWSGTMPFLLYATQAAEFGRIHLIDLDAEYNNQARVICNALDCEGLLNIAEQDANTLDYPEGSVLVINTSTDNISGTEWFKRIPAGAWVALQGRTGGHRDCVQPYYSDIGFNLAHPMHETKYLGEKKFVYPDHEYTRFMKIGIK